MSTLREAAEKALEYMESRECHHESTHRGGVLWTICDDCGRKWADDEGGFVEYREPIPITDLRAALSAPAEQDGWQLVPVGLTEAMHVAGVRTIVHCTGNDDWPPRVWHAMLADAPRPAPAEPQPERDFAAEVDHWMKRSKEWRKRAEAAEALLSAQPPAPQPAGGERDRYEFVLAQCREAQDIAASRGWALNDIATASTTDPRARKIATEALLSAPSQPAAQQSKPLLEWQKAVMEAYGHLWHVNNEPAAPIPMRSPEKAAYEARKCLRELLTKEERGEAINAVGQLIGRGITATKGDRHD